MEGQHWDQSPLSLLFMRSPSPPHRQAGAAAPLDPTPWNCLVVHFLFIPAICVADSELWIFLNSWKTSETSHLHVTQDQTNTPKTANNKYLTESTTESFVRQTPVKHLQPCNTRSKYSPCPWKREKMRTTHIFHWTMQHPGIKGTGQGAWGSPCGQRWMDWVSPRQALVGSIYFCLWSSLQLCELATGSLASQWTRMLIYLMNVNVLSLAN